jgi:hypothetical protein
MTTKKISFVTLKELTYTRKTVFSFNSELYALLNYILNLSLDSGKPSLIQEELIIIHTKLLKLNFEKNDNYKITITVFFKDTHKKKYNNSYATEQDLINYTRKFNDLKQRLERGQNIMYYQKNLKKFESAQLGSTKSLRIDAFLDFFQARRPEFFIYNQMVALQVTKKYLLFVTEYSLKTFVIKLEVT